MDFIVHRNYQWSFIVIFLSIRIVKSTVDFKDLPQNQPPVSDFNFKPVKESTDYKSSRHCDCDERYKSTRRYPMPEEQRLMSYLLDGYSANVRPVNDSKRPVEMHLGITLAQVLDMDEKNQILVTNIWMDQYWTDEFLTWNSTEFAHIKTIRMPSEKIWKPDLVLYNNAADFTDNVMPALAMIENTGHVFWPVPTKLKSSCKVDVTYFPFDVQICYLKFGSWTYDGLQVNVNISSKGIDLNNYLENGEWELISCKAERNVRFYPCCSEPYPDVMFYIQLRRRILYYMYHVIYPCIMMSTLTLLVFCLPPDSGEKIALGITVLLAFSVLMLSIAENLPETSESVPIISVYLTVVMSMTSVSVILTVFVLNLHHRGPNKKEVPNWLRLLLLKRDSKATEFDFDESLIKNVSLKRTLENLVQELSEEKNFSSPQQISVDAQYPGCNTLPVFTKPATVDKQFLSASMPGSYPCASTTAMPNHFNHPAYDPNKQEMTYRSTTPRDNTYMPCTQTAARISRAATLAANNILPGNNCPVYTPMQRMDEQHHEAAGLSTCSSMRPSPCLRKITPAGIQKTNKEILRALKKIIEKHELDDQETRLVEDWRKVAQFVDKILFWIYLFCTFASSIMILVIVPVFRIIPLVDNTIRKGNVTDVIVTKTSR